jgi:predicted esterase
VKLPALVVVAALLWAACGTHRAPPGATSSEIRGVQVLRVAASSDKPLVVALHGRGDTPEHFAPFWQDPAFELAVPRALLPWGPGAAWFDWSRGLSDEELSKRLAVAADRLWPAIAEIAAERKVVVVGFSLGAIMAYALAARHPEAVLLAIPIAGASPRQIFLPGRVPAPVYAIHGAVDNVLPLSMGREAAAAFREHGGAVELRELPGVGHQLTDEIHADVLAHVRSAFAR